MPATDVRPSPGFRFDPASHVYTLDGRDLPSVTAIIKPLFGDFYTRLDADVLASAARRGTAVHALTEGYDLGAPIPSVSYDAAYADYLAAWQRFKRDSGAEVLGIEVRAYHPRLLFAGTYDRLVRIEERTGILDIKTTAQMMPQTAIQLEGYRLIREVWHPPSAPLARWAVQLRPDGNYRFEEYCDPADRAVFLGLLAAHNWRRRNHVD